MVTVNYRYYRLSNFKTADSYLQISEAQIVNNGTRIGGGSITGTTPDSANGITVLNDNNTSTNCYWAVTANVENLTIYVQLDFGSPIDATGVKIGAANSDTRFPYFFKVIGSNDASSWVLLSQNNYSSPGSINLSAEMPFILPVFGPSLTNNININMQAMVSNHNFINRINL